MNERDQANILMVDDQPGKLLSYEVILKELGENLIQARSATRGPRPAAAQRHRRRPDGRQHAGDRWLRARRHDAPASRASRRPPSSSSPPSISPTSTASRAIRAAPSTTSPSLSSRSSCAPRSASSPSCTARRASSNASIASSKQRVAGAQPEQLGESEDQFRTLANSIPQLAWMADADGIGLLVQPALV